jgi:hypothetical protein
MENGQVHRPVKMASGEYWINGRLIMIWTEAHQKGLLTFDGGKLNTFHDVFQKFKTLR